MGLFDGLLRKSSRPRIELPAGWVFVDLHRATFHDSRATGVRSDVGIVGTALCSDKPTSRAIAWKGDAIIDLHESLQSRFDGSEVVAASNNACVGIAYRDIVTLNPSADCDSVERRKHIVVWHGDRCTDLGQHSVQLENAMVDGDSVIATLNDSHKYRVAMWSLQAAKEISDLSNDSGKVRFVNAVRGDEIGGRLGVHAALWKGGRRVDLHPEYREYTKQLGGPSALSEVQALGPGAQVGFMEVEIVKSGSQGKYPRAALWNGSAGSFTNLHPGDPYYGSRAVDTNGTSHVGTALLEGGTHAFLWRGQTAVNLHAAVPSAYHSSAAVAMDPTGTVVVGSARYGKRQHAVAWILS